MGVPLLSPEGSPKQVIMIAVAIGEMVGSDQVPDRQITGEPFELVMANVFQLERNGALSCVNSEVCPKTVDTADIVREGDLTTLGFSVHPDPNS